MENNQEKVPCMVGGWKVTAIPGTAYTFGSGTATWGPYTLSKAAEITAELGWYDFEGIAYAVPI
jgi:hypothetical protein